MKAIISKKDDKFILSLSTNIEDIFVVDSLEISEEVAKDLAVINKKLQNSKTNQLGHKGGKIDSI